MSWIDVLEVILNIFKGLLTPIIAGVVAYIAYQQHKTNRDKLRLDLYDKRLKVFHSLMNLLGFIAADGDCSNSRLGQYCAEIGESGFLFDKDITDYLEKIYTEAGNLHTLEYEIKHIDALSKEKEESIRDKKAEVFHWLTGQRKESQTRFEKYLGFRCLADTSERRIMNWKRGFRRITLVLGITTAICCATFGVFVINSESQTARYYLESKHKIYENHWGLDIFDRVAAETDKNEEKFYYFGDPNAPFLVPDGMVEKYQHYKALDAEAGIKPQGFTLDDLMEQPATIEPQTNRLAGLKEELKKMRVRDAEELKDLRKGFWVTLSWWQLLGLYIISGLAGGAVGFYGVWLVYYLIECVYYLIEWIILGFL